jgi:hypothetical protein
MAITVMRSAKALSTVVLLKTNSSIVQIVLAYYLLTEPTDRPPLEEERRDDQNPSQGRRTGCRSGFHIVPCCSGAGQQRTAVVNFVCSIEGAPAQLTAQVQAVNEAGVWIDPSGLFGGSVATGNVNYFYQGSLTSATARYSFTGTNQFADFVDLISNERFRVQMIPQARSCC